jgi:hypothetical protein
MRFVKDGKWMELDADFPSNHNGTIKECGEWAFPVFPTNRSLVGSPLTPYIWDDRCTSEDAAEQLMNVYSLSKEERKARGAKGREWALSDEAGFTSEKMGVNIIETLDELFATWKPREKYEFINLNEVKIIMGIFDKNNVLHRLMAGAYNVICNILNIDIKIKSFYKTIFTIIEYEGAVVFMGNISFDGID